MPAESPKQSHARVILLAQECTNPSTSPVARSAAPTPSSTRARALVPASRRAPAASGAARTDADEFVSGKNAVPVSAGEAPPKLPNQLWESRVKQLEAEQLRLFGPVFTQAAPGVFRWN